MTQPLNTALHDLIGIGFGPSNLALAIALQERARHQGALDALFLDKQADYRWHGNTLVTQSELQISFLKDLVSLRNPTSPYSFVNYLHQHGRLVDFINLGTFYPCRMEFNDYLRWVAGQFQEQSRYGEEVLAIEPVLEGQRVEALRVISRDAGGETHVRATRAVVVSAGDRAHSPGLPPSQGRCPGLPPLAVPGAHRQATLRRRQAHAHRHHRRWAERGRGLHRPQRQLSLGAGGHDPARLGAQAGGRQPLRQRSVLPEFTDLIFNQTGAERERFIREYHNTNYSVVDIDLIERIYGIFYRQKVSGIRRHAFHILSTVERANAGADGIELVLRNNASGEQSVQRYDAVVLATGYERQAHRHLLEPLAQWMGDFEVGRDYRIRTDERCQAAVYMQGFCQASHGLSDTLLSVLPIRADEIAASLYAHIEPGARVERGLQQALATAS